MENQSSRYKDNNERIRKARYEKRRRKRRRQILLAGAICTVIIVFLGYLVFVKLFSDERQKIQNSPKAGSEAVQETQNNASTQESETVASQIDQTALEEIITWAEEKAEGADAEKNADELELLNQRIQEAKDLILEHASEDRLGVAYLNLILAINAIA